MGIVVPLAWGSYLFGSIPIAYLLVRLLRGIDLREYGSGSVGGSNAGEVLGKWAAVVVGLLDVFKGALPVWAAQWLGLGVGGQMAVGLATIVGHNWPVFLNFKGGRGMAPLIGLLLAGARLELLLFAILIVLGVGFFRNVPMIFGLAVLMLPVWAVLFEEPAAVVWGLVAAVALTFAKRILGNRPLGLPEQGKAEVLLNRLIYDRDTRERQTWVRRGPPRDSTSAASPEDSAQQP